MGMQLGHAGRKGSTNLQWEGGEKQPLAKSEDNWPIMAASSIPYTENNQIPKEMDRRDMDDVIAQYVAAANRANEAGFDIIYNPNPSDDELHALASNTNAWIVRSGTKITAELLKDARNLQVIGRAGVGVDNIDIEAATNSGIVVMNMWVFRVQHHSLL